MRLSTIFSTGFLIASTIARPQTGTAPAAMPLSECDTGNAQCCGSVTTASNPVTAATLGLLGVVVGNVDTMVGMTCTPMSVVDVGSGADCAQQPVCCENNNFNGVISIGCTPISL